MTVDASKLHMQSIVQAAEAALGYTATADAWHRVGKRLVGEQGIGHLAKMIEAYRDYQQRHDE